MRAAFVEALADLAERDPRIALLTGDLGYGVVESFSDRFPDRFYNVGVAEQNMIGVATGLAESGMIPFVYSIATFATMRPYEFIRNGPILHQLPVRIVGVGSGFEYGNNGATHYPLEDVALMRLHRGLTVVIPVNDAHARSAVEETYALPQPIYYRVSKGGPPIPGVEPKFELGRLTKLREGSDIALIALGPIATNVLDAADRLASNGIDAAVAMVTSLNPSPDDELTEFLSGFSLAVSVEAHLVDGGLGTLMSEVIAERMLSTRLIRCGVDNIPRGVTGSQAFLEDRHGLSASAIANTVRDAAGSTLALT